MREPDVPVRVMVGVADGTEMAAVSVMLAEGCAGVRVRVDGLAVTPVGRPEMATEMEPLKELSAAAVTLMALLVAPAWRDSEPGETAREKSGTGFGVESPPQEVSRETASKAKTSVSALARLRMSG